jgi:hypothetical protein
LSEFKKYFYSKFYSENKLSPNFKNKINSLNFYKTQSAIEKKTKKKA